MNLFEMSNGKKFFSLRNIAYFDEKMQFLGEDFPIRPVLLTKGGRMSLSIFTRALVSIGLIGLSACTGSTESSSGSGKVSSYAQQPYNFRLSLTDAPNDDLTAVMVKVKYAELRVAGAGKEARIKAAENLGPINLLDLQNGVTLPMADLQFPAGIQITQIRLVLEEDGNYIVKNNETRCDLKTPSAQKTGVKILIHQGLAIDQGYNYSVVVDFDAKKSIVQQGNGGCLLKPVLKLKSASRVPNAETPTPPPVEEEVVPEDGSEQEDDGDGFDGGTDEEVPWVPIEDLDDYVFTL